MMKIRSIKTNFILNLFRVFSGGIVTIAIMPHINRILGPEIIGRVEYIYTIANYFVLFSAIGIPLYGVREIAKIRDNEVERVKATSELLLILICTTIISYIIYFGLVYHLSAFSESKSLLVIMSAMILLSNLGAEWYFQGIEDQLYITIRYIIVRIIAIILVFLCIHSQEDYLIYAIVLVLTLCGSNFFNFFYLVKILNINKAALKNLNCKKHFKPIFTIFIAAISINIYLQLDNFLIGFLVGDKYVGYYSVANKLIRFSISFITIIGAVMLPRLSNLYNNNDSKTYHILLRKAFHSILIISIPTSIMFLFFSEPLINLMAGKSFQESITTMQILSPLCIVVGIAYFFGYLVLYPQNKEHVYTKSVIVSALFSVFVNFFAIKYFYQNGAAVIAVLSEIIAIVIMLILSRKEISTANLLNRNFFKIIVTSILTLLIIFVIITFFKASNNLMLFIVPLPYLLFFVSLFLIREANTIEIVDKVLTKLRQLI